MKTPARIVPADFGLTAGFRRSEPEIREIKGNLLRIGILVFLFAWGVHAYGQGSSGSGQLASLTGVKVVIVLDNSLSTKGEIAKKTLEASRLAIQTDVELKLRTSGLQILGGETDPLLQIRLFEAYEAGNVDVELIEHVVLKRSPRIEVRAITWRRSGLGQDVNIQNIRDYIRDMIDQFVNDWLAANTKQH